MSNINAKIEHDPTLRINGQKVDWQSIVTHTGGSSGSIAFIHHAPLGLEDEPFSSWASSRKLELDLRECGFISSRMEPFGPHFVGREDPSNVEIWDAFRAWLDLPTYDIMADEGQTYRGDIPDGVIECRRHWKAFNDHSSTVVYFREEEHAKLCCRALACFLVAVIGGNAVRGVPLWSELKGNPSND